MQLGIKPRSTRKLAIAHVKEVTDRSTDEDSLKRIDIEQGEMESEDKSVSQQPTIRGFRKAHRSS